MRSTFSLSKRIFAASLSLSAQPAPFVLHDGTPVRMRLSRTLSSHDAQLGETVDFEVLDDVKVEDRVVVKRGAVALATVTEAQPKRRMGRGGKLNVNIDSVRLANGDKVALRAIKESKGGGHQGAMTGAIVGTAIVFFPAAPLFLLMHGKDITIPKGTEITAYINGEIPLDSVKLPRQTGSTEAGQQQVSSAPSGGSRRPEAEDGGPAAEGCRPRRGITPPSCGNGPMR